MYLKEYLQTLELKQRVFIYCIDGLFYGTWTVYGYLNLILSGKNKKLNSKIIYCGLDQNLHTIVVINKKYDQLFDKK